MMIDQKRNTRPFHYTPELKRQLRGALASLTYDERIAARDSYECYDCGFHAPVGTYRCNACHQRARQVEG